MLPIKKGGIILNNNARLWKKKEEIKLNSKKVKLMLTIKILGAEKLSRISIKDLKKTIK